jgi:hypothetical protein
MHASLAKANLWNLISAVATGGVGTLAWLGFEA